MIRINLLPHREMRRRRQQQHFFVMLGIVVALGFTTWFAVHTYLGDRLEEQKGRNKYLQDEIAKLDKQIAEIQKLKEQTAALLARKKVVETLQSNRSEVVHLLDQLVRQLPDGIYLRAIKQTGNRVSINGYTQSQARVSTLMRNLEASQFLENPSLVEIRAVTVGNARLNEFTMNISITRPKSEEEKKPAARPPVKKG
jgi:type IV pilus assembly protein PilN